MCFGYRSVAGGVTATAVADVRVAGFVTAVEVSAAGVTVSVFVTIVSAAAAAAAAAAAIVTTAAVLLCWIFCCLAARNFLCINFLSCTLSSIF